MLDPPFDPPSAPGGGPEKGQNLPNRGGFPLVRAAFARRQALAWGILLRFPGSKAADVASTA
jgi:hypothetical protein